jgi:hypothetical protein
MNTTPTSSQVFSELTDKEKLDVTRQDADLRKATATSPD